VHALTLDSSTQPVVASCSGLLGSQVAVTQAFSKPEQSAATAVKTQSPVTSSQASLVHDRLSL